MARHRSDLCENPEFIAGQTISHAELLTEIGQTSVRTLSYLNGVEVCRSIIFSTENLFGEETVVGFAWNTSQRADLIRIHDRPVACVEHSGFVVFKEAALLMASSFPVSQIQDAEKRRTGIPVND